LVIEPAVLYQKQPLYMSFVLLYVTITGDH